MGDKLIAVPTSVLRALPDGDYVVLEATSKQIDRAQDIGDDNWPPQADFSVFENAVNPRH
jgi:hypothetical protein